MLAGPERAGLPRAVAQEGEPRRAVAALVERGEAGRRRDAFLRRRLDDAERARGEPAAGGERAERRNGESFAVRRIEEGERRRGERTRRRRGVAADDAAARLLVEGGDVLPQRGERGAAGLDEDDVRGAARQGFEAEGAGAGEGIDDFGAGIGGTGGGEFAVRQDVE